jgi:hypothetical protein
MIIPPFSYMGLIKREKRIFNWRELPVETDSDLSLELELVSIRYGSTSISEGSSIPSVHPDLVADEKMIDP